MILGMIPLELKKEKKILSSQEASSVMYTTGFKYIRVVELILHVLVKTSFLFTGMIWLDEFSREEVGDYCLMCYYCTIAARGLHKPVLISQLHISCYHGFYFGHLRFNLLNQNRVGQ